MEGTGKRVHLEHPQRQESAVRQLERKERSAFSVLGGLAALTPHLEHPSDSSCGPQPTTGGRPPDERGSEFWSPDKLSVEPFLCDLQVGRIQLDTDKPSVEFQRHKSSCSRPYEWIQNKRAGLRA